jgi:putative transposase
MKASRLPEAEKAFAIKQGEDAKPLAKICREAGISQTTYSNWQKR